MTVLTERTTLNTRRSPFPEGEGRGSGDRAASPRPSPDRWCGDCQCPVALGEDRFFHHICNCQHFHMVSFVIDASRRWLVK